MIGRVYCWRPRSYSLHPSISLLYVNCGWRLGTSGKRECCCLAHAEEDMEISDEKRLPSGGWEEELPLQCFSGRAPNTDNMQVQCCFSYHLPSVICVWITSRGFIKRVFVFHNTIININLFHHMPQFFLALPKGDLHVIADDNYYDRRQPTPSTHPRTKTCQLFLHTNLQHL